MFSLSRLSLLTLLLAPILANAQQGCVPSAKVVDETLGKSLPIHTLKGQQYIQSETGHYFSVKLSNQCDQTYLGSVHVDGKNSVSMARFEEPAEKQGGYVLFPGAEIVVHGWRLNNEQASAFMFAPYSSSFKGMVANQTTPGLGKVHVEFFGKADQVVMRGKDSLSDTHSHGKIDVLYQQDAAFPLSYTFRSSMAPSTFAAQAVDDVKGDKSVFVRNKRPSLVLDLNYADAIELRRIGLFPALPVPTKSQPLAYDARHIPRPAISESILK